MKLQAIKKRCLAAKRFIIVNCPDGTQMLSDGANYYRMIGIRLHENYIQDVFGLTDKQADKCAIYTADEDDRIYREDYAALGVPVQMIGTVWAYDQRLSVLECGGALTYIPEDAISASGHDYYDMRLVTNAKGEPMVALYHGVFLEALLGPCMSGPAKAISAMLADIGGRPVLDTAGKGGERDEAIGIRN